MPYAPRITTRSVILHARPNLGAQLCNEVFEAAVRYLVPVNGAVPLDPPAKTYAPGRPPAAGFGSFGSIIEYRSLTSAHGVKRSHRRPRLSVNLGLIFKSS